MTQRLLGSGIWGLILSGVLKLSDLHFVGTHSACGAWGCGPPLEALIACHGAWLVILAPAAILASKRLPISAVRTLGSASMILGALGVLAVAVYEHVTWLSVDPEFRQQFFCQRCLFSIATWTDVPLVEAALVGACLLVTSITWHCEDEIAPGFRMDAG